MLVRMSLYHFTSPVNNSNTTETVSCLSVCLFVCFPGDQGINWNPGEKWDFLPEAFNIIVGSRRDRPEGKCTDLKEQSYRTGKQWVAEGTGVGDGADMGIRCYRDSGKPMSFFINNSGRSPATADYVPHHVSPHGPKTPDQYAQHGPSVVQNIFAMDAPENPSLLFPLFSFCINYIGYDESASPAHWFFRFGGSMLKCLWRHLTTL